ncbi:exodeoxyribonuclease I [Alteromonadaceae bacterium M269]|nr:exodeoxyribonuclease I [Alteromonadaceae bacterium M269]
MSHSTPSLFFYDFETWGTNPKLDFPSQFAGIRTDNDLNIIGKPVNIYCQIPNDYLPQPQAALITGISPQQTLRDGLIEPHFIGRIMQEFSQPNTCVLGYNSLRFDDEVTRFTLYRNFHDPYGREWQNGNSRWDIIDMVRACYALRPEGINWPTNDEGLPSFKLENLSKANGLEHEQAHDAMSDVYATIAVTKLIKEKQPKLYHYLFDLRLKQSVLKLIDVNQAKPLVHISSKISSQHGCCTWILPIAWHPVNKNAVICLNLSLNPEPLFELTVDEIIEKLYRPSSELAPNEQRLPLKLVHINKCPVLAPAKTLTAENAERLDIDRELCLKNLEKIKNVSGLASKMIQVYDQERSVEEVDADEALYSGGFFGQPDKEKMAFVREAQPEQLIDINWEFNDPRLNTLLFRYRARHFPQTLSYDEQMRWQQHRQAKLADADITASIKADEFVIEIERLVELNASDANKVALLKSLYEYGSSL